MDPFNLDEREDVQKKVLTKWINSYLLKVNESPVIDLFVDLKDGIRLLSLLQALTGKQYKREKGRMRLHHLNNVNKALQVLESNGVRLVNISSEVIVDGNPKLTLGLIWNLVLRYAGGKLQTLVPDNQYSSLERALLSWCQRSLKDYPDIKVTNFTSCWSDGRAFVTLIHRWRPGLIDHEKALKMEPIDRLRLAFRVAHDHLNIDALLDPEDVNNPQPDKKSIMMYVMCLFQSLPTEEEPKISESETTDASRMTEYDSRPSSLLSQMSVDLVGYQTALEDVLTWLLAAEEQLSHQSTVLPNDLALLKKHFHEHESFLSRLASHQDEVGAALTEGTRLIAEPGLRREEEREIQLQMDLLNRRWERLRLNALERQDVIHSALRSEQRKTLDSLRKWLTHAEERMAVIVAAPLKERREKHTQLQKDIERQKSVVDTVADIVVIVDDEKSDDESSAIDDELTALSERWAHVCNWSRQQSERLRAWMNLTEQAEQKRKWLDKREVTLKHMEANPGSEIAEILNRIKRLQVLRKELDSELQKLQTLQDEIQALANLDGPTSLKSSEQLQSVVETLFDRWEALSQIVTVQAQRISNSGFEINLSNSDNINFHGLGSSSEWELVGNTSSKESKKLRLGEPFVELDEYIASLSEWLRQTELQLKHSLVDVASPATALSDEEHLAWYTTTLEELNVKKNKLLSVSKSPTGSVAQFDEFNNRIELTREVLSNRIQDYEHLINLKKNLKEMSEYINEMQEFLNNNTKSTFESVLELSTILSLVLSRAEEIEKNHVKVSKMNEGFNETFSKGLIDTSLKAEFDDLIMKWNTLRDDYCSKCKILREKLNKSEQTLKRVQEIEEWLDDLRKEMLPTDGVITSSAQLFQLKARYQHVQDKCSSKILDFEDVEEAVNNLSPHDKNLMKRISDLIFVWKQTHGDARARLVKLQQASGYYGQFRSLAALQTDWLDRLERRLARASPTSADAEDISEELDDLVNYISGEAEDRMKHLREAVKNLESAGVAVPAVTSDLKSVMTRWERLRTEATDRAALLERSVCDAQKTEAVVLQFQEWLDRTDAMLAARLKIDLTADDLPDDDQILSEEFEAQEQVLQGMQQQFESLEQEGKHEAAMRLKEQLDGLRMRFSSIQVTYERFRKTDCIEARLSRALRQLREVRDASCLLEPASADIEGIEGQLKHCLKFYRMLSEVKAEITDIIKVGRKLVEEKAVADPMQLSNRVDGLKEMYNTLGAQVTAAKKTLEQALELLRAIHRRNEELNLWLDQNEDNVTGDIVAETKPLLKRLLEDYDKFCKMCDPVYSHSLKESITNLKAKWEWLENKSTLVHWLAERDSEVASASEAKLIEMEKELMIKKAQVDRFPGVLQHKWKETFEKIKAAEKQKSQESILKQNFVTDNKTNEPNLQEDPTFTLAESSSLFSQVSNMTDDNIKEQKNAVSPSETSNECHVVEVKESETPQSFLATVEVYPSHTHQTANHNVEMVEIIETESTESIPDASLLENKKKIVVQYSDVKLGETKSQTKPSVCLEMTDRVNRIEQTKVTAWKNKEYLEEYSILDNESDNAKPSGVTPSVIFKKEVELSKTYSVIGNISDTDSASDKNAQMALSMSSEPRSPSWSSASVVSMHHKTPSPINTNPITINADVVEFETQAKVMLARMDITLEAVRSEKDPGKRFETLKTELSILALDSATLISRGDSLVLSLHSTQPVRAERLRTGILAKLRAGWARARDEMDTQRRVAAETQTIVDKFKTRLYDIKEWIDNVSSRVVMANNHEEELQKLKEEFDRKAKELQELTNVSKELHSKNIEHSEGELAIVKTKWQHALNQIRHICVSPKSQDKFATHPELKQLTFTLEKDSPLYRFGNNLDNLISWVMETKTRINLNKELPQAEKDKNATKLKDSIKDKETEVKEIFENYANLESSASRPIAVEFQEKMKKLREDWSYVKKHAQALDVSRGAVDKDSESGSSSRPIKSPPVSPKPSLIPVATSGSPITRSPLIKQTSVFTYSPTSQHRSTSIPSPNVASPTRSTAGSLPTSSLNVFIQKQDSSSGVAAEVLPPSPPPPLSPSVGVKPVSPLAKELSQNRFRSRIKDASGPETDSASGTAAEITATLLASFDKSILQIRDWLTVEEGMLRQQSVVVSNVDEIVQLIDKQKSVLRELEQKKPQLDELVHTAENLKADSNRQQLHGKVTKLREHWDETNSRVMQRKAQLDAMLGDSQRYEGKRLEVEAWLARMESRLQRMAPAAHTADVLEAQLREQKSFHAELHQYKHQIELFNQLTQKLIAVYQQDDTTRVKKMTEQINVRYNSLNTSIINRGKLLNSAMNSLHNFDRSLDKFLAWLSEAESSLEAVEVDAERLSSSNSRQDSGASMLPHHQLKKSSSKDTNLVCVVNLPWFITLISVLFEVDRVRT